jgi:hypothetical protein
MESPMTDIQPGQTWVHASRDRVVVAICDVGHEARQLLGDWGVGHWLHVPAYGGRVVRFVKAGRVHHCGLITFRNWSKGAMLAPPGNEDATNG